MALSPDPHCKVRPTAAVHGLRKEQDGKASCVAQEGLPGIHAGACAGRALAEHGARHVSRCSLPPCDLSAHDAASAAELTSLSRHRVCMLSGLQGWQADCAQPLPLVLHAALPCYLCCSGSLSHAVAALKAYC